MSPLFTPLSRMLHHDNLYLCHRLNEMYRFPNPSGIKPPIARQVSTPAASASDLSDPCAIVKLNGTAMTPACLQELYGIPATPATVASNGLAVAEYEYEYAEESDLHVCPCDTAAGPRLLTQERSTRHSCRRIVRT